MDLIKYRKFVVAIVGAVLALLAAGVLPAEWAGYVNAGVAVLTALGVYQVPNGESSEQG